MKKILIVFGTRPEAIKMAPLVKCLKKFPDFDVSVCVTGQHREMLDQVLEFFQIKPDFDLNIMKPGQDLYSITSDVIIKLKEVLDRIKPDFLLVHGDTTTSTAAALAGFYAGTKIVHVEAGLRTFNKCSPFPEEMNRQITSRLSDLHFAPTQTAKNNLIVENIQPKNIFVTGNTVIDALLYAKDRIAGIVDPEIESLKTIVDNRKQIILVTGHRRENFGGGFLNICKALKELSCDNSLQIIYPVHLNPNVQGPVYEMLGNRRNISLVKPLNYPAFVWLLDQCNIVLTDSGGIQEEAPSLGKPVLVMRATTERPEAVEAGTVILVGTDSETIVSEVKKLLNDQDLYLNMSKRYNPYGDGNASEYIANILLSYNV